MGVEATRIGIDGVFWSALTWRGDNEAFLTSCVVKKWTFLGSKRGVNCIIAKGCWRSKLGEGDRGEKTKGLGSFRKKFDDDGLDMAIDFSKY